MNNGMADGTDLQPTKQELYQRCHEMGDIVEAGLANAGAGAA